MTGNIYGNASTTNMWLLPVDQEIPFKTNEFKSVLYYFYCGFASIVMLTSADYLTEIWVNIPLPDSSKVTSYAWAINVQRRRSNQIKCTYSIQITYV